MMAISGVIWDASLYLVDFLIQLEQNFLNQYKVLETNKDLETIYNSICNESYINNFNNSNSKYNNKNNINNSIILNDNNILSSFKLGRTLDLGCGTGIAGIMSILLNSSNYVLFSDMYKMDCFDDNLNSLLYNQDNKYDFVKYTWNEEYIPDEFLSKCVNTVNNIDSHNNNKNNNNIVDDDDDKNINNKDYINNNSNNINNKNEYHDDNNNIWDTIICSDLLYEEKYHHVFLSVLKRLTFTRAILAYKKRHHEPELLFFEQLSINFSIEVIHSNSIILNNLPTNSLSDLYLLIVKPK